MNSNLILFNEQNNDRSTIHLYFNNEMHSWIAYGCSAYLLRVIVKSKFIDSIRGFSTRMQMPYTVVNKDVLRRMYDDFWVEKKDDEHYVVRYTGDFDVNDYTRWVNKLQEELALNGGFDTQTHISHLVPKDVVYCQGMRML